MGRPKVAGPSSHPALKAERRAFSDGYGERGRIQEVSEEQPMRKLVTPLLFSAGLAAAALTAPAPANAAPVPVTTAAAIAGDSTIDQVHYRRHRHYRHRHVAYGPRYYGHRRYYARRHYNPAGAAFAGAALGLFGTALAAATAPTYYYPAYYPAYSYYPAYYGGWGYPAYGYRRAYWGGGYGGWGYRRAYWGGGWRHGGWGHRRWRCARAPTCFDGEGGACRPFCIAASASTAAKP
jgi:hypothetical protein